MVNYPTIYLLKSTNLLLCRYGHTLQRNSSSCWRAGNLFESDCSDRWPIFCVEKKKMGCLPDLPSFQLWSLVCLSYNTTYQEISEKGGSECSVILPNIPTQLPPEQMLKQGQGTRRRVQIPVTFHSAGHSFLILATNSLKPWSMTWLQPCINTEL